MMHGQTQIKFHRKFVQKLKTHILHSTILFLENRALYEIKWENVVERGRLQMALYKRAYVLRAGYIRLRTRTQNIYYLLLVHYNNVYTNAPQYYVTHILPVLLYV